MIYYILIYFFKYSILQLVNLFMIHGDPLRALQRNLEAPCTPV